MYKAILASLTWLAVLVITLQQDDRLDEVAASGQPSAIFSIHAKLREGDLRMCIVDCMKAYLEASPALDQGVTVFYDCRGGRIFAFDGTTGLLYIYVYPFDPVAECEIVPMSEEDFATIGISLSAVKDASPFNKRKGYEPLSYFVLSARKVITAKQLRDRLPDSVITVYTKNGIQEKSATKATKEKTEE